MLDKLLQRLNVPLIHRYSGGNLHRKKTMSPRGSLRAQTNTCFREQCQCPLWGRKGLNPQLSLSFKGRPLTCYRYIENIREAPKPRVEHFTRTSKTCAAADRICMSLNIFQMCICTAVTFVKVVPSSRKTRCGMFSNNRTSVEKKKKV